MSRRCRMIPAVLLALGGLATAVPAALGQTSREPAGAAVQAPEPPPPESAPEAAESYPVFAISSVEVLHTAHAPVLDIVAVHGVASAEGWSKGELVPLRQGASADGVLDLVFVAQPPQESAAPTSYAPIQAVLAISPEHPFRAIRVRGATNSVQLRGLSGYMEAKVPPEPCTECVGKLFLASGGAAPAGVPATDIVRETDLPPDARIIRPADGIRDTRPNPNRLTVLLDESDRVVDAVWE